MLLASVWKDLIYSRSAFERLEHGIMTSWLSQSWTTTKPSLSVAIVALSMAVPFRSRQTRKAGASNEPRPRSARPPRSTRPPMQESLRPFGSSRMLPRAAYVDPDVFAWEQKHFFGGGWTCVGRSSQTPAAGACAPSRSARAACSSSGLLILCILGTRALVFVFLEGSSLSS